MMRLNTRRLWQAALSGVVLGLTLLAAAGPAAAQSNVSSMMPGQNGFQPMVKPDQGTSKPEATVPTALPGASPGLGAAPADKSVADLAPNEALFDAINRGDIGQARDAVTRGADLHAQNVLGMTPLELSVDLSRNDITFLLLSLRGASAGAISARAAAAAATSATSATKPTRLVQKAAAVKPVPASPPLPRQYAGSADPGQPDPQAGFLGFGRNVQ